MGGMKAKIQRRFWDSHASGWDSMRSKPDALNQIDEVIASIGNRLPAGGAVLDIGCGTGQHAVALAAAGFRVTAVDYSSAMLGRAKMHAQARGVEIDFRLLDLNGPIGFQPGAFDGALCVSVLQVLDEPSRFVAFVSALLRPGGVFLIESVRELGALSHGQNLGMRDRAVNGLKALAVKVRPSAVREYTPADIVSFLEADGFSVVDQATFEATFTVLGAKDTP
jgi:2-polyprenyl-3-methyl-5-hydroxy-6-metoxy-1,4-benzoquinol methylase